jgi:YegS/Rv2252/BmrU family lipid kinase
VQRLVAILNPNADRGRAATLAAALQEALRGRLEFTLLETGARGEAVDLARDAAQSGCDAVLAIGGDGAMHEVANGLMAVPAERRPPLGVIPAGSGNDLAFALGIDKDLGAAVRRIERGATRAIDVGLARTPAGQARYCVNNVGLLLEGQINLASHELHWPRGSGLYLRAALETLLRRPAVARLELTIDGQTQTCEAILLSIGDGPRSGGKFFLHSAARVDDGRFDYLAAPPISRARLLWRLIQSTRRSALRDSKLLAGQFSDLKVRSDIPLPAHIDGEPWLRPEAGVREMSVDVLPGALRVLAG